MSCVRGKLRRGGLTLLEALAAAAVTGGLLLIVAILARQSTRCVRQVTRRAALQRRARAVFARIGDDLAGLGDRSVLLLVCQSRRFGGDAPPAVASGQDELQWPDALRTDQMILTANGAHRSLTDGRRASNFARILYAQTGCAEQAAARGQTPGAGWTLARHQTLMLSDPAVRGADFAPLTTADLAACFGEAMQVKYHHEFLFSGAAPGAADVDGELAPWRAAANIARLGRDGVGPRGEPPGGDGGGDLTAGRVYCTPGYDYATGQVGSGYEPPPTGDPAWDGFPRPRIHGPGDLHRLLATGVVGFAVDFSDGRTFGPEHARAGELAFYPDTPLADLGVHEGGPAGGTYNFAFNGHSPGSVRQTLTRVAGRHRFGWDHNGAGGGAGAAEGHYGRGGWPWPTAIRVRLLLADGDTLMQFEQVYHLQVR
jgi:hypothetical protein